MRELGEIDRIVADADEGLAPVTIVLTGPGGVGKTAIAVRWAHTRCERYQDGQLYADLAGHDTTPTHPSDVLGSFLRALGVPAQRVPVDLAEQAALYRSLTARRSMLVVLDNAFSVAQVRVLLPASPTAIVLVTSRSRLTGMIGDGATLVEVEPLGKPSAVRLLARAVGGDRVAAEAAGAEQLVELCGGYLPIAVRVAAARLVTRPRWPLGRMIEELSDERRRLSRLSLSPEMSVQATFELSYRSLRDSAAVLYRRLALHPGHDFDSGVTAAVMDGDAADPLEELLEANLLEEIYPDRYRFHDLLRPHAQRCAEADDPAPVRSMAVRRIAEWYLRAARAADEVLTPYRRRLPYVFSDATAGLPSLPDRTSALRWLETERANLIAAARAALDWKQPDLAWQLADVMWPLLLLRKHYRDRLCLDELGLDAARAWGNVFAEADMRKRLGRVLTTLGRYEEAEHNLRLSLSRWAGIGDARGTADAQECLALLYWETNRPDQAVELFQQLVTTNQELGAERSEALTRINLGLVLIELGRPEDATEHLEHARYIFDGLGDADPYNGARALIALARARCLQGKADTAQRLATAAMDAMHHLGSDNGRAEAHQAMAEVAHSSGDRSSAVEHLRAALRIFTELGSARVAEASARLATLTASDELADIGP